MKERSRWTRLHTAAKVNDVEMAIKSYHNEPDSINVSSLGDTPLIIAARYNSLEVGKLLIEWGSEVNRKARDGRTPLWILAAGEPSTYATPEEETNFYNRKIQFIKLLLKAGANPDPDRSGNLPEFVSGVWMDSPEITELFIEIGRVDPKSIIYTAGEKCTRLLIEKYGVDPNIRDKDGKTPLHYAVERYCPYYAAKLLALLEYNADTTIRDYSGRTALDIALIRMNTPAINILSDYNKQ